MNLRSAHSDYRPNDRLDNYNALELDENAQSELSIADRLAVDHLLDRRDRQRARAEGRVPAAFLDGAFHIASVPYSSAEGDDMMMRMPRRHRRRHAGAEAEEEEEYDPHVFVCYPANRNLIELM